MRLIRVLAFAALVPAATAATAAAHGQVPVAQSVPNPAKSAPYSLSSSVLDTPKEQKFDVVSIKPSDPAGGRGRASLPLTTGERWAANDGYFSASGQTLERYVAFAFDMEPNPDPQLKTLPDWTNSQRYDIEARTNHPMSKNEMRAMMRNLLADRFKLTTHFEVRSMPVYTLTLSHPGKLGPQMREHADEEGMPCDVTPAVPAAPAGGTPLPATPAAPPAAAPAGRVGGRGQRATPTGYPQACGELVMLTSSLPGRWRYGARNVTMDATAIGLRAGMDRPVIDLTGLTARYDWQMEYVPDLATDGQSGANFAASQGDPSGPKMWTAMPEQLGLKLTATKMDIQFLVFDHIERPTGN